MATKKRQGATVGENGSAIQDIPHEEVLKKSGDVSVIPKIITTEDQIKLELAKFNVADSAIAKMKKDFGGLTVSGVDDKSGYTAVRSAWSEVRTKRTGLEKKGLELRNGYGVITKAIKKEEDRLVDLITPLEDSLYKMWKDVDEEKERVKKEAEEAEQRQLMERIEELQTLGMVFSDGFYRVGETIAMDVATIRAFPVEQYDKLKVAVKAKADEIQAAKELSEKEEADRKAEFDRQQAKLKEDQDKLAEQQRQFQEQQEQMQRDKEEAAKLKLDLRLSKLETLGMKKSFTTMDFDNGMYEFSALISDIAAMDEKEWELYYDDHVVGIKDRNDKKYAHDAEVAAEQAENERRQKFIAGQMGLVGMTYNYNTQRFGFINNVLNISVGWGDFNGVNDDEIRNRAADFGSMINKAKKEAEQAEADEKLAKEKEEQLAMSDNDRFQKIILAIEKIAATTNAEDFKTKKSQAKATNLRESLFEVLNKYTS